MKLNIVDTGLVSKHVSWEADTVDLAELLRPLLVLMLPRIRDRAVPSQVQSSQLLQKETNVEEPPSQESDRIED